MDDSDDEEETIQVDKPRSSVASELENSLDCRDVAVDPLEFWRNHRQSFPRLFEIVKQALFAPEARQAWSEFLAWLVIF